MELALIPPISLLQDTMRTNMQLVLPQLLEIRPDFPLDIYSLTYKAHCTNPKQYVIMDNGAAEDQQLNNSLLLHIASLYKPDELAIPDVLANGDKTLISTFDFFEAHQNDLDRINGERETKLKLGFVAQGKTIEEVIKTVVLMRLFKWADQIDVIYIPRLLIKETIDPLARIKVYEELYDLYEDCYEYHLFGASTIWPAEISTASQLPYKIRSMDTSLPYVMAHSKNVIDDLIHEEIARPKNYFNRPEGDFPGHSSYTEFFLNTIK